MPKTKYSEDIKKYAVELYVKGSSAPEVSKIIGANEATIRNWVEIHGEKIRVGNTKRKFSMDIVNEIVSLYNSGMNTPEIEKALNLKRGIPSYLLRKYGYELRHRGPKSKIGNEEYFDCIDTEEKAYYLGWLIADGNISITNGQYCLKIHIGIQDKELVDKFLVAIRSSNKTKIKEDKTTSYYTSLSSIHMCSALIKLGVVPNKSGKEIFPCQIPKELYPHFIRGVFDGDGITDIKKKRSGFVGSYDMIVNIMECIGIKLTIFQNYKNNNIFYYLGGKKYSKVLYDYLYENSTVWLTRKRQRLEDICFN